MSWTRRRTDTCKIGCTTGWGPHARPQDGPSTRGSPQGAVLGPDHRCHRRGRSERIPISPLHPVSRSLSTAARTGWRWLGNSRHVLTSRTGEGSIQFPGTSSRSRPRTSGSSRPGWSQVRDCRQWPKNGRQVQELCLLAPPWRGPSWLGNHGGTAFLEASLLLLVRHRPEVDATMAHKQ